MGERTAKGSTGRASSGPAFPEAHRRQWNETYRATHYRKLPWFSPRPSDWIVETVRSGRWRKGARILDVGCGAGSNSLYLARRGFRVSGIDIAEGAIQAARARAIAARRTVDFQVGDVLRLPYPDGEFGGALDIGCFHTLPISLRRAFAKELARVLKPGARFVLSFFAREYAGTPGPPHRPSLEEATAALEEEFLFRETRYGAGFRGPKGGRGAAVYFAVLERRAGPRPPPM